MGRSPFWQAVAAVRRPAARPQPVTPTADVSASATPELPAAGPTPDAGGTGDRNAGRTARGCHGDPACDGAPCACVARAVRHRGAGHPPRPRLRNCLNQRQPCPWQGRTATRTVWARDPYPLQIEVMRQQSYPGSAITIEQTLAPGTNYSRSVVSYKSDGYKIFALMTVPNGQKPSSGWP